MASKKQAEGWALPLVNTGFYVWMRVPVSRLFIWIERWVLRKTTVTCVLFFLLFIKWCNLQSYGAYRIKCRIVILLSLAMLSGVIEALHGQLIPDSEKVIFS